MDLDQPPLIFLLVCILTTVTINGRIAWNAHNTVFGSKHSAICAQAVYFLHSIRPRVTWLNNRWWLAACNWVMSAISAILSGHVWRCRKFGEVFCTEYTGQGEWLNWFQW